MAKLDFKQLMVDKGEKIGLAAAGVVMLGLVGMGGLAMTNAENPSKIKGELEGQANSISQKVQNNPSLTPQPLPGWVDTGMKFPTVQYAQHPTTNPYFDILLRDDQKRRNPAVFGIVESQVELVRAPMITYDVIPPANDKDEPKIGVITTKEIAKNDQTALKKPTRRRTLQRSMYAGPGGMPMGGMPMGGMPMGGMPMGGMPGMPGGLVGMQGLQNTRFNAGQPAARTSSEIEYVALDKFEKEPKFRPAELLRPVRFGYVVASYPYKQQLEEMQRALRYNTLEEFLGDPTVGLKFNGFNVQRQVKLTATGAVVQAWAAYDWQQALGPVVSLSTGFEDEKDAIRQTVPPYEHELTVPLPRLARENKYPDVTLKTIKDAVETLAAKIKSSMPVLPASQWSQKLRGQAGIFEQFKQPAGTDPTRPGMMPMGPGGIPGRPMDAAAGPGGAAGAGQLGIADQLPDYVLVRFLDANVMPGYTYEYRVQVKIANPNYKRTADVGRPSWAEMEELTGPWVDVKQQLVVPEEAFLYVAEAKATPDKKPITPTGDTAMVQMQRWYEAVRLDPNDKRGEPVGDWVVMDMPVRVGEYVGGRMYTPLPLWSPFQGQYILRDDPKKRPRPNQPDPPKGVPIDFSTQSVVAAISGGAGVYEVPNGPRKGRQVVTDEAGMEVVVVTPDGKLRAMNSALHKTDPERETRKKEWDAWVKRVDEATRLLTPAGTADPFGPMKK